MLVVVVVLGLPARKAIDDDDDDDENGKTVSFSARGRRRRPVVLGLLVRKAIEDEHDDDNGKTGRRETREFPALARARRRPRSTVESNRRRARRR